MKIAPFSYAILLALVGCTSVSTVAPGTKAVMLDRSQTCHYYGRTFAVTFPEGRYQPAFQTERGVFYSAPTPLIQRALSTGVVVGGLFVPGPADPEHRQGFWMQASGVGYFRLTEPVVFHYGP